MLLLLLLRIDVSTPAAFFPLSLLYDIVERRAFMSSTTFPAASLRDYMRAIVQTATQQWPQQQSYICALRVERFIDPMRKRKKK
jgi:hypothetical protein